MKCRESPSLTSVLPVLRSFRREINLCSTWRITMQWSHTSATSVPSGSHTCLPKKDTRGHTRTTSRSSARSARKPFIGNPTWQHIWGPTLETRADTVVNNAVKCFQQRNKWRTTSAVRNLQNSWNARFAHQCWRPRWSGGCTCGGTPRTRPTSSPPRTTRFRGSAPGDSQKHHAFQILMTHLWIWTWMCKDPNQKKFKIEIYLLISYFLYSNLSVWCLS